MQSSPRGIIDAAAYLAEERGRDEKHVFWDGEVFAMAGGSPTHNLLVAAVLGELRAHLRGRSCQPYGSGQRIGLPGGKLAGPRRYVYPDASVVCRPVLLDPDDQDAILNPSLVVEVLSASTEAFDRGDKFLGYRSLESLTDYLLISQTVAQVEHYARSNKAEWVLRTYGPMDTIDVRSLGWAPRVRDLYEGVLDTGDP